MATELGTELRAESFGHCHQLHPDSREDFIRCLCENVVGLCRAPPSQLLPTTVTATTPTVTSTVTPPGSSSASPFVPADWTRSYSVTAGLCALFLAMCAVIIVLRIMSKRNEPQSRNRVSVSTVPVPDSDPPPYDVVVRLPPSYISREPPPYCEIDIDKFPSPIICPRQPVNVRSTAETSISVTASRSAESTAGGRQPAAGDQGTPDRRRGDEPAASYAETHTANQESTSTGAGASNSALVEASTSGGATSCMAEVTVVNEVKDTATPTDGSESASR